MLKKTITLFVLISLFFINQSCDNSKSNEQEISPPILGVWEYMFPDREGMAFITENHYVHFLIPKQDIIKSELIDSDKVKIFDDMALEAGTLTIRDSIVTCKVLYNKNPNRIGTSFKYSYSIDNNILTWNVIDDDGNVVATGKNKRVE